MGESELENTDASAPAGSAPAENGKPIVYKRCRPGESLSDPRLGDVVLVRGTGWLGKSIRFGLRMRYRRDGDRALARICSAVLKSEIILKHFHNGNRTDPQLV
jgi:hypothetical protein